MFNPDFYPTPESVAAIMLNGMDLEGRVVLEPSAGSGNLVDACMLAGAKQVLACEVEVKLRDMLSGSPLSMSGKLKVIGCDFLNVEPYEVSHIGAIVMNPPFSDGAAHILHAWNIAPNGCEIVALCNSTTIQRPYSRERRELFSVIEAYGSYVHLGALFKGAERSTDVEVSLVRLKKPVANSEQEFEGFFIGPDQIEAQGEGIIRYNLVRDGVNRYVEACRIFDRQLNSAVELDKLLDGYYKPKGTGIAFMVTENGQPVARNTFQKELQKQAWSWMIKKMNLEKLATSGLMDDINKFVEEHSEIPFTMRNVYRMIEIIISTHSQRIDKAVEEVFDKFTKYTKENRWSLPGWKTNEQYLFGKKFIIPYFADQHFAYCGSDKRVYVSGGESRRKMDDLIKVLCTLTGKPFDSVQNPEHGYNQLEPGVWYDWGFFRFKVFLKGTGHFQFKDMDDWARLNKKIASIKGLTLPEKIK